MSRTAPLLLLLPALAGLGCNAGGSESGDSTDTGSTDTGATDTGAPLGAEFERITSPLVEPRELSSPATGAGTMIGTSDPCAVWDPLAQTWRIFWTYSDYQAELDGLAPIAGIAGGSSADGIEFVGYAELALDQQGTFDELSVETCDVVVIDDPESATGPRFLLFYSGSRLPTDAQGEFDHGPYAIALATSDDGVRFEPLEPALSRDGVAGVLFGISDVFGSEEVDGNFITDPVVVVRDDGFHMWTLCITQVPEPFGGICYHTSPDAISWTHHGLVEGLDRAFPIQPTVFFNPTTELFEMYVVMDTVEEEAQNHDLGANLTLRVTGFYHATSTDGLAWTWDADQAFAEDTSRAWENGGLATGADAELRDDVVWLFYPSFTTEGQLYPPLLNWVLNLAQRDATP